VLARKRDRKVYYKTTIYRGKRARIGEKEQDTHLIEAVLLVNSWLRELELQDNVDHNDSSRYCPVSGS